MEELLKKQSEHLAKIVSLLETDRLMQASQTYESHRTIIDDRHVSKKIDEISVNVKAIHDKIEVNTADVNDLSISNNESVVNAINSLTEENKSASKASKEHLAALKKIQETLKQNTEYREIAEKAKGTPIFKSFKDDFRDLKESFAEKKKSFTESINPKNVIQGIASSISPRYKDRLEYIKNEQNLGSKKTEKTLKKDYDTRSQMLQRNVKNEALLEKTRGSLTEEEFLKGDTKIARQYLKEKEAVGKGLKKTDSRYSLDEKVAKREERASARLANKFKGNTEAIQTVATQQAAAIAPMGVINLDTSVPRALSSRTPVAQVAQVGTPVAQIGTPVAQVASKSAKEDLLESSRSTKDYQTAQLTNASEQKEILTDQLTTQEEILKVITETSEASGTTSDGGGITEMIAALIKSISSLLSTLATIAKVAAVPAAVGVVGAAVATYAADKYQESFGEGGFDLVKKLHDDKVIDYNATVMGYNPSEILDWKAIEALPPKELKTLMDSGVEFSREDTSKLHELYNKEMIASSGSNTAEAVTPEGTKAEAVTPEGTKAEAVTPEGTKAEAVTPEAVRPSQAESVYNKSGENAGVAAAGSTSSNNIVNAPTINNNSNTTQNNIVRLPVRNQDNTINRYVSSRMFNQ